MLKQIDIRDVRLGMFIQELCGSWIHHPFWKKAFELTEPKDLQALQECGIAAVIIDTEKGLDAESGHRVAHKEATPPPAASIKKPEPHVSFQDEIRHAEFLFAKSKKIVSSVFKEARLGNALHIDETISLVDEITRSVSRNSSALLSLVQLKSQNDHTYAHSVAVSALMIALGTQMNLERDTLKSVGMAGLLHDIGKMMLPPDILNKPGKLTADEFEIIKTHHSADGRFSEHVMTWMMSCWMPACTIMSAWMDQAIRRSFREKPYRCLHAWPLYVTCTMQ
jgi:hypothetical protein